MDFQVVKRKHFFRSEVRILRFDGSNNTLQSHDEHGKSHKPISISRIKDIHKDAHHHLRLIIYFKGGERSSQLDFANEEEIDRFVNMIRFQRRVTCSEEPEEDDPHPHHKFLSIFSRSFTTLPKDDGLLSPRSALTSESSFSSSFVGALPTFSSASSPSRKKPAEYAQQRMRSEHSLRRDMQLSEKIHCSNPTHLFTGDKVVAELSGGTIIAAFPKDEVTGRAAIKKMVVTNTARQRATEEGEEDVVEQLMQEVYSLAHSHHPNVVELFEGYAWDDAFNNRHVWMVMEYMTHQSLTNCLEKGWDKWDKYEEREGIVAYVAREVCNGLAYLHSFHRVHRDIKSDNIFVSDGGSVKIGDLGSCVQLTKEQRRRKSLKGTPNWLAPECIRQQLYDQRVDVWATGVTVIEMLESEPPYFDDECMEAMQKIVTLGCPPLQEPQRWSEELKDFLESCVQVTAESKAIRHSLSTNSTGQTVLCI